MLTPNSRDWSEEITGHHWMAKRMERQARKVKLTVTREALVKALTKEPLRLVIHLEFNSRRVLLLVDKARKELPLSRLSMIRDSSSNIEGLDTTTVNLKLDTNVL